MSTATDGHFHDGGSHEGWKGHDGHAVHSHDAAGRTYWRRDSNAPAELAAQLDRIVAGVAAAGSRERLLLGLCRRCRNSLLYLVVPAAEPATMDRAIVRRLRALEISHEAHDRSYTHADDAVPQLHGEPRAEGKA